MPEDESESITDSSYLFNADAQAVLEEAPDLETGLALLRDAYESETWDDPKAAAEIASKYAQDLRFKFSENQRYSQDETHQLAPIDLEELEAEGESDYDQKYNQISNWESANKEFLETTTDPDYLMNKDKLLANIENYASEERRALNKNPGVLGEVADFGYRILEGATANPAKAIGADAYAKWLHEKTNPSRDDDFSSDIAAGIGNVGAIIGIAATGGVLPTAAYLTAQAGGAIEERYEQSIAETGDVSKALKAGTIEAGGQIIQSLPAGKIYGSAGRALGAKLLGKEATEAVAGKVTTGAVKAGLTEATAEGAGQVVSNIAEEVGTGREVDPFTNVGKAALLGAIFGTGAGALETWAGKRNLGEASTTNKDIPTIDPEPKAVNVVGGVKDPKPESVGEVNAANVYNPTDVAPESTNREAKETADFITSDGNRYTYTENGATERVKVSSGDKFQPFDKTFFVNKETAAKLAVLRDEEGPDGSPIHILTDGDNLYVKSEYVTSDLTVQNNPTGARLVPVPVEEAAASGLHPVEVNRPRNQNGNLREYRSHIGREITEIIPRSVGAAVTEGRALGQRLTQAKDVDPEIQARFGQEDFTYLRYFPISNVETLDAAEKYIAEKGVPAAVARITETPDNVSDPETVAIGFKLFDQINKAVAQAKEQGDLVSASRLADSSVEVMTALAQKLTNAGQTVQAASLFRSLDPSIQIFYIRNELYKSAVEETAAELGISPRELAGTDLDLVNLETEIKATEDIIKREDEITQRATEEELTPEIQETGKLITEIDKAAKERLAGFTDQENAGIAETEAEADRIEDEGSRRAEQEVIDLKDALRTAENRIAEIEREAEKRVEEQRKAAEEAQAKVKELEGRVTPETKKSALNQIEKLKKKAEEAKAAPKTKEDLITPSEKKEIERLTKLLDEGKGKIDRIKSTRGLSDSERNKVAKLRDRARDQKLRLDTATSDSFLSAKELSQKNSLIKRRDELREKKAAAQKGGKPPKSALSESSEKKLKELLGRKDKLSDRKKKLEDKKQAKVKKLSDSEEKLVKIFNAAKTSTGSTQEKLLRKGFELQDKILDKESKRRKPNPLHTLYIMNLMSNWRTQARNIIGNLANLAGNISSAYITGLPQGRLDGNYLVSGIADTLKAIGTDIVKTEFGGKQTFKPQIDKITEDIKKPSRPLEERFDLVDEAPEFLKKTKLNLMGYVGRMMSAMDALTYLPAAEGQFRFAAFEKYHKQGLRGDELKSKISNELFNSKEEWQKAETQAKEEQVLLRDVGEDMSDSEMRIRAWQILDEKRLEQSPELFREAHKFAQRATFTQTPEGVAGWMAGMINEARNYPLKWGKNGKEYYPLKYIVPFVNTPVNIFNELANYFPGIGVARITKFGDDFSSLEKRNILGKQILGSLGVGILYGLAKESLEEKDPYFAIYGNGPKDYGLTKQLQAQGWRPRTFKIGDSVYSWEQMPIALSMAMLGEIFDQERWSPAYDKKQGLAKIEILLGTTASAFLSNTYLKNLGDFLSAVQGKDNKSIGDVGVNIARGFIPGSAALNEITKMYSSPIETKDDLFAKFISGIPVVQDISTATGRTRPALNEFGEPVGKTFQERLNNLSTFWKNRTTDPEWRFMAESGYNLPRDTGLSSELFRDPEKKSRVGKDRAQKYGDAYFNVMTPDERYKYVQDTGPRIKATVKQYRERYGGAGYKQTVQDRLDKDIAAIRRQARQRIAFGR